MCFPNRLNSSHSIGERRYPVRVTDSALTGRGPAPPRHTKARFRVSPGRRPEAGAHKHSEHDEQLPERPLSFRHRKRPSVLEQQRSGSPEPRRQAGGVPPGAGAEARHLRRRVPPSARDAENHSVYLPHVLRRLQGGVPPAELGQRIHPRCSGMMNTHRVQLYGSSVTKTQTKRRLWR